MNFNWDLWDFENGDVNPSKIAFVCSDRELSWDTLFKQTTKLKTVLLENLGNIKGPIIIYGHKESLFPIAIIACLMAGIPYVPVDVINPINRLNKIREISNSNTVINCSTSDLAVFQNHIASNFEFAQSDKKSAFKTIEIPKGLAYIIFTSGSTGNPKGVMISREALRSFVSNMNKHFNSSSPQVYLNQALFSFDISLFEFCLTLSRGETCVLCATSTVKNTTEFISILRKHHCSFWNSTPSFVQLCLTQKEFNQKNISTLQTFMLMGEVFNETLITKLNEEFSGAKIYNGYGPTEATVIVGHAEVRNKNTSGKIPMSNFPSSQIILSDDNSSENNPSEIIITGAQVAEGYLNNTEKDVAFFNFQNTKAYRTGDFGYVEKNQLFFHSRKDDQIKYNGFRIEPAEIDNTLMLHSMVEYSLTVPLFKNNKPLRLITFIPKSHNPSLKDDADLDTLRTYLQHELPAYMAKPELILLEELPFNSSFKVDKTLLVDSYLAGT